MAGSILIQTDRGEGCQIERKESGVCGKVQMKLGAVSRHFEGHGLIATCAYGIVDARMHVEKSSLRSTIQWSHL